MAGILFLRDIDVDIQMRCRNCGHEGLLARGDLERRFGPSYPVLSIAPHYRCSRCHSKDVESSPGPLAAPPPAPQDEDTVDAGIAALQGLLDAVRGGRAPAGKDTVEPEEEVDDVVDLMPQLREAEVEAEADEGIGADDDLFERTMASLRTVAHPERDEDEGDKGQAQAVPEPDTVVAGDEDIPFERSLAALRDLIAEDEAEAEAPAAPSPAQRPPDPRAVIAEIIEEEEEREPFFRPREGTPPSASEMELSLAALRALVEKAAEEGPEPEEPQAEDPEPARTEPAAHDDEPFDETIAALRSLIADRHRDADEDEGETPPDQEDEPAEDEPENLDDISDDEILSFAIRDPELASDDADEVERGEPAAHAMPEEPLPPIPQPPARISHLNETLAKLRGMLELDRPDKDAGHKDTGHKDLAHKDGEPAARPRRR